MPEPRPFDVTALAATGPWFALEVGPEPASGHASSGGWRSAAALVEDREALRAWIDWGAERLGTSDRTVAASVLFQAWAARVTAIHAGGVALAGAGPDLAIAGLSYRYRPEGGAMGLAVERVALLEPAASWRRLVEANLDPLAAAVRSQVRLGRRLLWGNVASGFAGALAALARAGHGPLTRLVACAWARPAELASLGAWHEVPADPGLRFRRTTCCLFERLPGAGRCGDCSLDRP